MVKIILRHVLVAVAIATLSVLVTLWIMGDKEAEEPPIKKFNGVEQIDKVKSINHRGYNKVAPENTLAAYVLSKEMGYDYVETDIQFTKDGVPVLLHDATINRVARNADGSELDELIRIGDITYDEVLKYDFGIWMGPEFAGTKITRFEDFIKVCWVFELHPYLELKDYDGFTHEQIDTLVDIVWENGIRGQETWISYSEEYLGWISEHDPVARLGVIGDIKSKEELNERIDAVKRLKNDTNEVFLDACNTFASYVPEICEKEGVPMEVWFSRTRPKTMVREKAYLNNMSAYVSGVTTDEFRYFPKKIDPIVTLSESSFVYDGTVKHPEISVKEDFVTLDPNRCYTVTYSGDCIHPGTYQLRVNMKGNFSGSKIVSFVIRPKEEAEPGQTSASETSP